jgi:small subunit ribosomal protein S5
MADKKPKAQDNKRAKLEPVLTPKSKLDLVVLEEDSQEAKPGDYRSSDRGGKKPRRREREDDEFDTRIINVRRVSRMYKGGRRMRLSVFVVIGDKLGHVGAGLGKGADVAEARKKAIARAKKSLVTVALKGKTIPHEVDHKHKASYVLIKPAAPGTGIVAGSTVKAVLELVGVQDALTKVMASNNPINVAYATIAGLHTLRSTRL